MRGHRPPSKNLHVQPCWSCANAVPSVGTGCPWSERFEPVPGWKAKLRVISTSNGSVYTYQITRCPLYRPE